MVLYQTGVNGDCLALALANHKLLAVELNYSVNVKGKELLRIIKLFCCLQ